MGTGGRWGPEVRSARALLSGSLLALVAGAASCGGGGGGGSGDGGAEDPLLPLVEGATVAELELTVPDMQTFTLRGCIPVPPGTFRPQDDVEPFGVVDQDGETYGAQTEVVSWYADDATDGADVVEVIARVTRGALVPGTRASYRVVVASHAPPIDPGEPGIEDLLSGPRSLPASVQTLLQDPTALELRSYDCFGNQYGSYPLNGAGEETLLKYGEHVAELKVPQHLAAVAPTSGPTPTLPHWLAAHMYISAWNDEEIVGFDLRIANADSGLDPTLIHDDPLDKVYFERIELAVPNGWVLVQDFEDPFFGPGAVTGGKTVFPIVDAMPGGKMHVIKWGGQFHRRLALCRPGQEERARDLLRGAGLGFAKHGFSAGDGNQYWSWWNEQTARYFPQSHLLPILDHVGLGAVVSDLEGERDMLQGHLENGTSGGSYPVDTPVLGWAHPYGVDYGGMSGGAEINLFDGVQTAWAKEVAGYQKFRILHRMQTDRMSNALFNLDGEPTSADDWVQSGASGPYVPFSHFIVPSVSGTDAFGFYLADQSHIDHVTASGLQPAYESQLFNYAPHDFQHFIRYTRSAKVLAWIANDSVAKDDLRTQAEMFKLSFHEHANSAGGYLQVTGMAWDLDYVTQHPAAGFRVGRGEGWGLDCSNAAYATASPAWRAQRREWFDTYAQLLVDGQGACNGFLQSNIQSKFLDAKYRARQGIEHVILDNAVLGMLETVYRGDDVAFTALLESLLGDSYYALVSDMSWGPGEPAPWQYSAVGPLDEALPIWCSLAELPSDGFTPGAYENFQNWSEFAYAQELTGDLLFLNKASQQLGFPPDLLGAVEGAGLSNLPNRAGLLALLQHQNGDF